MRPSRSHWAIFRPAVLPLGTLTGTTGAIVWRAAFHVACMRLAAWVTASFRAVPGVWTVHSALYLVLVAPQHAIAGALHNTTSSLILARAFLTEFHAPLIA
jgi:hypothetical protein